MGGRCSRQKQPAQQVQVNQDGSPKTPSKLSKTLKPIVPGSKNWNSKQILSTVPQNRKQEFKEFVKRGHKHVTPTGQNLLMIYVWFAEPPLPEVIEFLIKSGISPGCIDNIGWTALHYAASNPFSPVESLELLAQTASYVSPDGNNALIMLLMNSNYHISQPKVRMLIRAGSDLTVLSPYYYYEIEGEVLPSLIADRMNIAKLVQHRK